MLQRPAGGMAAQAGRFDLPKPESGMKTAGEFQMSANEQQDQRHVKSHIAVERI